MKVIEYLKKFFSNMAFMFRRTWKYAKSKYFLMILDSVKSTVQPFVLLIIPKYILDELASERRVDVTLRYIAYYAAAVVGFNLISLIISRFGSDQSMKIDHRVAMDQHTKWLHMDYDKFENGRVRDLEARSVSAAEPRNFAEDKVLGFISNLIRLGGYTYIIMSLHPIMILFILTVIAANSLIARRSAKLGYEYTTAMTRLSRRFNYIFRTMVDFKVGKDVRINGADSWLKSKFEKESEEYIRDHRAQQRKLLGINTLSDIIGLIQTVVMYGYCGYLAISGGITVGSFTVFLGALTAFTGTFNEFVKRFPALGLLSKYIDDYREFLRCAEHEGKELETSDISALPEHCDIEFVNVSFKYPDTDRYVLKNINIKIKAGERLSIVGYNGAGKSTFIKLLCRFYKPTEGKILLGGVDISTYPLPEYPPAARRGVPGLSAFLHVCQIQYRPQPRRGPGAREKSARRKRYPRKDRRAGERNRHLLRSDPVLPFARLLRRRDTENRLCKSVLQGFADRHPRRADLGARPRSGNTALRALQRDHRRQDRRLHFTQTCKRQVLRLDRGVCRRRACRARNARRAHEEKRDIRGHVHKAGALLYRKRNRRRDKRGNHGVSAVQYLMPQKERKLSPRESIAGL